MSHPVPGPFGPAHPDRVDGECYGFAWVGQPFTHCDTCSQPYWKHRYEAAFDRENDEWYRQPIAPSDAARVKAKWDR